MNNIDSFGEIIFSYKNQSGFDKTPQANNGGSGGQGGCGGSGGCGGGGGCNGGSGGSGGSGGNHLFNAEIAIEETQK
ncbi:MULTISPECIES: hypothetical protein [Pseudomonas]|uniref:hypothetical protein n=1 Tax=Pseudomonas TaxID=286 RepID=UPI002360907A|nr:hypothetical protein [Pseudomonas asplenii]